MTVTLAFQILRQSPDRAPWSDRYELEVDPGSTILDCLNQIKWQQDGSLAFRKNCRNTICGSCAMRINGRSTLACKESVAGELERLAQFPVLPDPAKVEPASESGAAAASLPTMVIAPLGNLPVVKDLIVDMAPFWADLRAVDPYVSTASRQMPEREFLQTPAERAKLDQMGNCILCGACYSECNAKEVNPTFVGPHALAKAWRTLADGRDDQQEARLAHYNDAQSGVWACTRCNYCDAVCPMEVAPLEQISQIKSAILQRSTDQGMRGQYPAGPNQAGPNQAGPSGLAQPSSAQGDAAHANATQTNAAQANVAIRHRKVLIDMIKRGGWIDERRFGLRVVGNSGRDVRGLLSLAPLGWRLLKAGKFPLGFEPSSGTAQVRSLITAVEAQDHPPEA